MHMMWTVAVGFALFASALLGLEKTSNSNNVDHSQTVASRDADSVRVFAWAATSYVKNNPLGSTAKTLDWNTLKNAPGLAPAVRGVSIPLTWKLRGTDTQWAICVYPDTGVTAGHITDSVKTFAKVSMPSNAVSLESMARVIDVARIIMYKRPIAPVEEPDRSARIALCP